MIRLTALTLTLAAVIPLAPVGCPINPGNGDTDPTERGVLTVTATATDAETGKAPEKVTYRKVVNLKADVTSQNVTGTVTYAWIQKSGPGVEITDADKAEATLSAPSVENDSTVVLMVTACDEADAIGQAEVSISVAADPNYTPYDFGIDPDTVVIPTPEADAGNRQRKLPGDECTLDGSDSSGYRLTYRWRQVSGRTVTLEDADTINPKFTTPVFNQSGDNELVFELTVTDYENRSVTDQVIVVVRDPDANEYHVVILTSKGEFTLELFPDDAPLHVENFLNYVDDGFYDGLIFHRVIEEFVIQTGGFGPGLVRKIPGDTIENESDNGLSNLRGTLAAARTSDPDSAASQWYVNLVDNENLDYNNGQPGYTVFGKVISGMDVVDAIGAVDTESQSGFNDVPVEDVVMISAQRE